MRRPGQGRAGCTRRPEQQLLGPGEQAASLDASGGTERGSWVGAGPAAAYEGGWAGPSSRTHGEELALSLTLLSFDLRPLRLSFCFRLHLQQQIPYYFCTCTRYSTSADQFQTRFSLIQ